MTEKSQQGLHSCAAKATRPTQSPHVSPVLQTYPEAPKGFGMNSGVSVTPRKTAPQGQRSGQEMREHCVPTHKLCGVVQMEQRQTEA